ncbi:tagatose-bisphosphate aldolase [Enterococcus sp. UD-01]|jgi:tagatose 1,6-diphosphate aldolase|uniref:tagatose-bisphosphate aldolase n=1 Tax=Enterococcus sp. UD-01 TaxID=3373911 RepID=UPI00383544C6
MKKISKEKFSRLKNLVDERGIISALAIDQRGALKKMIGRYQTATDQNIIQLKKLVSQELTPYASAILLDPEYGLPASQLRDSACGLLLAYEKTGYDATTSGRLPDSLPVWSVKRLREAGADACKFLLYYDADESAAINHQKQAYIERIGSECLAEGLPFFLEILSYDANNSDNQSLEYAKVKPHKVIEAMKEFSKPAYNVDVLKVEVPVNINFVAGFGEKSVYTKEQAQAYFEEQSNATDVPFIFLSAGVSAKLFQETLNFARQAGSTFNGVLCGRATWANVIEPYVRNGTSDAVAWLQNHGKQNIKELNAVLKTTASSIFDKIDLI